MPFTQGHALLIGVDEYLNAAHLNVPAVKNDAFTVAAVLRDPRLCGYPEEQVTLLSGPAATRQAIMDALDALAAQAESDDTILLFYAGHGHYGANGAFYLLTSDTRLTESPRKVIAGTALDEQELMRKIKAIRAERVLLIFNACHSGEISPVLDAGAEPPDGAQSLPATTSAALLATGSGRIIITACRPHQYAFVGRASQTIFGQVLAGALRGQGVRGQRGYISAFELYSALYFGVGDTIQRQIDAPTRAKYGAQEPELTVIKGVGPFAVALYQGIANVEIEGTQEPPANAVVRAITAEESQQAYQQIVHIEQGVGIGGNMTGGTAIGHNSGTLQQSSHTVNAHSYVEGNQPQQGVFISGGSVYGPVIGTNSGSVVFNAGMAASSAPQITLTEALAQVQTAQAQAGDADLADDLGLVVQALQSALKAESEGKTDRRALKLREAQAQLDVLARHLAQLQALAAQLRHIR